MRIRMSSKIALLAVAALFVVTISPAGAVTNGDLDGTAHPEVVLILMEVGGQPAFRCSGTMIAPTIVLTAGHCTSNFPGAPFTGMRVFYESDVDNGNNNYPFAGPNAIEAADWAAHPDYPTGPFFLNDVGIIKLDEPVPDVLTYGALAAVGSLDDLRRGKKTTFTSVGYGLQRINPVFVQADRVRMVAHPHLIQINVPGFTGGFSMLLSNNHSTGGTCFGDSGGPNFLRNSNIVAGITSFGINGNCAGTGGVFRTDKQNVHDFVNDFINAHP